MSTTKQQSFSAGIRILLQLTVNGLFILSRYRKVFWNSCDSFLPDTWNQTKFRASGLRNRNVLFREIFSRELLGPSTRDQKLPIFLLGMYWCSKKYTTVHVTLTQRFFTGYFFTVIEWSLFGRSHHGFWTVGYWIEVDFEQKRTR